ncbi:MAG: hypothetical protein ACOYL5_20045 [Phototrophicaceae bacterium]|jgi:indole-3-glycerol phosphate synthase
MNDALKDLIDLKNELLYQQMQQTPLTTLRAMAAMQSRPVPLLMENRLQITLIGQISYEDPLSEDTQDIYDPIPLALDFVDEGVHAVALFNDTSVEREGFTDLTLVNDALKASNTPLISQDYILHEYHIVESRAAGASAVTLNASLVNKDLLRSLTGAAHRNLMTGIVHVFNALQLDDALEWSPQVIGLSSSDPLINAVDLEFVEEMCMLIPASQRVILCRPLGSLDEVRQALKLRLDAIMVDDRLLLDVAGATALRDALKIPHPKKDQT